MPATPRMRSFAALPLLLVMFLVASTFALATPAEARTARQSRIYDGFRIVANQKGDPYQYGADGPGAFDCSGLTYFSFRKAGFSNIPRTSDAQARWTDRIKRKNMRKGDLMFFYDGGGVYHVGVFSGWKNGLRYIVHAPYGGKNVHRASPWTNQWFAVTLR